MGTKNNPAPNDCYAKAEPDEPMFVLLARDPDAPALVRMWVTLRKMHDEGDSAGKILEAMKCADDMETWHKANRR